MTERLDPHLSDDTLNEYLDGALHSPARSAVEAHLAGCPACAARAAALSRVFTGLATLPDAPLSRDLRSSVMAAVRARPPLALRPIADPRRPAFRLVFILQSGLALGLLAFAWPFVMGHALALPPIVAGDLSGMLAGWIGAWVNPAGLWPALQNWAASDSAQLVLPNLVVLQPLVAGLVLAAAGALWVLGNALLLRHGPAAGRHGNR